MRRRALFIALGVGLAAGGAALAQGQSNQDAYQLPEPSVSSAQVLRLPRDSSCVHITRATVRFLPPPVEIEGMRSHSINWSTRSFTCGSLVLRGGGSA